MAGARVTVGPLGQEVTVAAPDGRLLRAMLDGAGDDLVVLEAGLGGSGLTWGPVHARLARVRLRARGSPAPRRGTTRRPPP